MTRRALLTAAVVAALAGCAEPQPPEFLSTEQKFRVRFGRPPKVFDQPDGALPTKIFTVTFPDGAYTVRAYELPVPAEDATRAASKLLDEAKNDLFRSVGAEPTTAESITLAGKYPGRSFTATASAPNPGVLRGRIYLAGTRLYKVTVFGTPDFANAPAASAFLDSFMVTE
jgi:hypothetical protein